MADLTQFNKEADDLIDRAGKELSEEDFEEFLGETANKCEAAEEALHEDQDETDEEGDAMDESEDEEEEGEGN